MMTELGVLRGMSGRVSDRVAPVINMLTGFGLTSSDDDLVGAIHLALMHRSYLFENQNRFPGITPKHLDVLSLLGTAFQRRSTVVDSYQRQGDSTAKLLNRELNHVGSNFPAWAAEAGWLRRSALLGKGYVSTEQLPKKVITSLAEQLLGVLCLAGENDIAEGLLTDLRARASSDTALSDPRTTLQEFLPDGSTRFEFSRSGPDHAPVFHAVVTDAAGRRGIGEDSNKKAAGQAAALDFIRTHCPDLPSVAEPSISERRIPNPIVTPPVHAEQVAKLQEMFDLPLSARGLLSQALIHKSWAYENSPTVREAGQQDNQVLAFLGSQAVNYEYFLAIARAAINSEHLDLKGIATPRNSTYAEALHLTGCAAGLLLGVGQARTAEISTDLAANTFQALLGAVLAARKFPASLGESWPQSWRPVWDLIAQGSPRPEGPNTRLDTLATTMQLSVRHNIETDGPEHALRFRAKTDLDSAAIGRLITLTGTFERSKGDARARTAESLLGLIDALAEDIPTLVPNLLKTPLQFLVAHQATEFAAEPTRYRAWAQKRLFGLHLLRSPAKLVAWAEAVDRLVGNDIRPCSSQSLTSAFTAAIIQTLRAAPSQNVNNMPQLRVFDSSLPPGSGPIAHAVRTALTVVCEHPI